MLFACSKINQKIFTIAILGFTSALPLPLISSNLSVWLAEEGLGRATIAGFALLHLPYSLRILWSPLMEKFSFPFLGFLGRRRSWTTISLILCQLTIFLAGLLGPQSKGFTACVLLISLFSGWIYLASVSYEVNVLSSDEYRLGSTWVIVGYRLGLVFSGAATLYLASFFGWQIAYLIMSGCMTAGIATILLQPEPQKEQEPQRVDQGKAKKWILHSFDGFTVPIINLFKKNNWIFIFLLLLSYRLGQDFLDRMIGPFYLEIGFTKIEIANATKIVGMAATFVGALYASYLLKKMTLLKGLLLFGFAHAFSHLCFWVMTIIGKEPYWFYFTIFSEQLTSGMMITGLIAFLWSQCQSLYAATQYTFLWSILSFKHDLIASLGGSCVNHFGWSAFFLLSALLSCPSLILLSFLIRQEQRPAPEPAPQIAINF